MFEQLRQCFFDKHPENQNIDATGVGIRLFRGGRTGQSSDNAIMLMNTLGENNKHRQFAACQTMAARPDGQEILRLDRRVGLWGLGSARPEIYRNPEKQKSSY